MKIRLGDADDNLFEEHNQRVLNDDHQGHLQCPYSDMPSKDIVRYNQSTDAVNHTNVSWEHGLTVTKVQHGNPQKSGSVCTNVLDRSPLVPCYSYIL